MRTEILGNRAGECGVWGRSPDFALLRGGVGCSGPFAGKLGVWGHPPSRFALRWTSPAFAFLRRGVGCSGPSAGKLGVWGHPACGARVSPWELSLRGSEGAGDGVGVVSGKGAVRERGGALLTVLWLVAALTAIAFSVATTVRTETERTSTHIEQVRAYYLATGALDRALLWMNWGNGARTPDGRPRFYEPGMSVFNMMFPSGVASVEIIPESARLNVNRATPQELGQLLLMLGVPTGQAQAVTAGIVMARSSNGSNAGLPSISPTPGPTFRPRFASFEQIEELMYVPGVTPDLFHGTWSRGPNGALQRLPGLKDCLTVYGINDAYDINTTPAPVLMAIGVPPDLTAAIVQRRMMRPFVNQGELGPILGAAGPAGGKLRIGGNSTYTLRATATLRTQPPAFVSDVRRSASMVVKFNNNLKEDLTPYWILRWYDNAGTN